MEHIGPILTFCKGIFWLASEAKACKKRCRRLADRVKTMEQLVETIKQRGPSQISPNVNRALYMLSMTLTSAQELVRKCTKTKFLNLVKCNSEFSSVNESLRDIFQLLSASLQVEQGNTMLRMFQDYTVEEDDEDWVEDLALVGSAARTPARYPASASPRSAAVVHVAMIEMEDDAILYAEGVFVVQ